MSNIFFFKDHFIFLIHAVKEKGGGPEEPFNVVGKAFWVFTKSFYVLGYWSKVEIQQWTDRWHSCPHRGAFSWKEKGKKSSKRCGQKVVSAREEKAARRQRSVCGRIGVDSFQWGCREGLARKVTIEWGKGEVRVVCSTLGVKVISLSLPYPLQVHLAYYVQLLHGNEWVCFYFSPMLYFGACGWLLFSPALNAGVWHIAGARYNN